MNQKDKVYVPHLVNALLILQLEFTNKLVLSAGTLTVAQNIKKTANARLVSADTI